MAKIDDLTNAALEELEASPEIVNLRMVVESQYETWTQRLFPMLQGQKRPCYAFVVGLLHQAGHTVATEELVRKYISRIRAKRGVVVRQVPVSAPSVTLTAPARATVQARGVTLTPAPVSRPARPVAVRTPAPVAASTPAVQSVVPVSVSDWMGELTRLEKVKGGEWTGADQWMWEFFVREATSIGEKLPKGFMAMERYLDDPIKADVMNCLIAKARAVCPSLLK